MIKIFYAIMITTFFSCANINTDTQRNQTEEYPPSESQVFSRVVELTSEIIPNSLKYERINGSTLLNENPKITLIASIRNTSDHNGTYKFSAILGSQGDQLEFSKEEYLMAGETKEMKIEKEINPYSFKSNIELLSTNILNPTIEIIK